MNEIKSYANNYFTDLITLISPYNQCLNQINTHYK